MQLFAPGPSEASKKFYERSEFRVALAFLKVTEVFAKKLPRRTERKRSSIEFERSENQGQFFNLLFLNIF